MCQAPHRGYTPHAVAVKEEGPGVRWLLAKSWVPYLLTGTGAGSLPPRSLASVNVKWGNKGVYPQLPGLL